MRTKKSKRFFIFDGYENHYSMEFKEYYANYDIITLYIPAHFSHKLQPLNVFCFSPLKRAYSLYIESLMRRYYTHIAKKDFLNGFYDAFKVIIISDNIKSGFAVTGFVLFDPNTVFFTFEIPPVIPTPTVFPLTSAGFIFPPAKTPKNIRKTIR